jgi:hypothetical protein
MPDMERVTYVVPITLPLFKSVALEAEGAFPGAAFLGAGILGQGQLTVVVVPGAEEVDSLGVGGGAESEGELNGGHYDECFGGEGKGQVRVNRLGLK